MNMRSLYPIYAEPVRLEKVIDGLWVTSSAEKQVESIEEFFRSAKLFTKPMIKAELLKTCKPEFGGSK